MFKKIFLVLFVVLSLSSFCLAEDKVYESTTENYSIKWQKEKKMY